MTGHRKIFVAIASYRDKECQWTLKSLFESALHPERVFVGVFWQCKLPDDADCFVAEAPYPAQVREKRIDVKDAKGACWAKRQALDLWDGEDFILLIDSHMRFAEGWDREMLDMLASTNDPKALLSTYPAAYTPPDDRNYDTPRIVAKGFDAGIPVQKSIIEKMQRPEPNPFVAGGFIFAPAGLFQEVPYDPDIYFIGEEISFGVRAYTRGWNVYTPHQCLIHHYYGRKDENKHWTDHNRWHERDLRSFARVRHLLGIEFSNDPEVVSGLEGGYGLGTERSLDAYQLWSGVFFAAQTLGAGNWRRANAHQTAYSNVPGHDCGQFRIKPCRYGSMMFPTQDVYIGKALNAYGEWGQDLFEHVGHLLKPGDVVADVGANLGTHALAFARQVGRTGRVLAFEPERAMYHLLCGNIGLNNLGQVICHQLALGESASTGYYSQRDLQKPGNHGVVHVSPARRSNADETVQIHPLDSFRLERLDMLKVSVCGAELSVLRGAAQTLARCRPLITVNNEIAAQSGILHDWLSEHEYRIYWLFTKFYRAENFYANPENLFGATIGIQFFAVPRESNVLIDRLLPVESRNQTWQEAYAVMNAGI